MRFRIKECAHEQGLRLGEIARKLRIPLSNLSAINSGSRSVSLRLLARIAKLLNSSVADLLDEPAGSVAFKTPGLGRVVTRIEGENPFGTDKAWVHRVMLAQRGHYGRVVREKEGRYGKK